MKKNMPKMDMGGLYTGASMFRDVENQPVSGYGTSDANRCPPNCSGSGGKHADRIRERQRKATDRARRNAGRCRRRGNYGQIICD